TSITSINGVTLISCCSDSSLPSSRIPPAMGAPSLRCARDRGGGDAAVEIAGNETLDLGGSLHDLRLVARDGAGELVVDDDGGNGGDEADGCRKEGFGDAGRDDGEVGRLRLGDADEAVHDAPHGAEQTDERRGGADGGEQTRADVD